MIIAALALWAGLAASAAPEPAPTGADCAAYAGDDHKLCAALAVLLPDVEAIWNKPYEIPRRLPGLEKNWEGLKDLSPAAQEKLPPALREQWTAVADSVAKFPTAEQYRTLTGLAKADAPELRAALKAAGAAWAPDAGEKAGAFLALDEKGAPSAPLPPDALKALYAALSAAPKGPSEEKAEGGKAAPDAKPGEPVADAAGLAKIFDAAQDAAPLDERASPGPRRAAAAPAEPAPPQAPQPKKSAAAPAAAEAPPADAPGVAVLKGEKSMLLAMVAAGVPGAAENLVEVDRELLRADSDRAAESWLKTHGSSAGPAGAEAALDASDSGRLESAALKKLVEARGEALAARDDAGRGAALEKIKTAAAALQEAQRAIMKSDPGYFKAREAWAASVEYNRTRLPEFADGARFTSDELGLPPGTAAGEIVKTSRRDRDGKPLGGVSYRNKDGLEHFETYDRKVSRDELKPGGGKSVYMENDDRDPGGKMVTVFYDDAQKKTGATVLTPLGQGLYEMTDEAKPWPKTRGRFAGGQFVAERSDNEDGSHRVLDAKTGIWVSWAGKEEQGLPDSFTVDDAKGVNGIKDPRERKAALDAMAAAFIRGRFPHKEKELPEQFQYEADSVSAMLDDYLRSAKGGAQITFTRDSQLIINEFGAKGALLRQVVGTFEPTLSGLDDGGAHGVPQGLTVAIRNTAASPDAQFVRVGQYLGNWGREEVRSRQDSNAENFSSWFVGVTVTENASVIRYAREAAAGGEFRQDGNPIALKPEQLYSGVGVVGAFRDAAAIVGKGTVNLIGAGVSVGLAASPLYSAVVYATGGDGEAARRDLMERAKANYFQNAVSQELGRIYTNGAYQDGLASLGIDSSKNVQNVGQEMKGLGYEGAGAVLQGGVNFANSQFNPEQYLMIKGLSFLGSGALGATGKLAETLVAGKMTVEAGYGLGTAANRMRDAYLMYDEHDPASRAEYYDAMRSVTEQGLGAPMLFGGLDKAFRGEHGESGGSRPREPAAEAREPGAVERAEKRAGSPIERALDSKLLNFGSESAPGAKSLNPWEVGRWLARESHIDLSAKRAPAVESPGAGTPDAPPPLAAAAPRRRLTLTENIDPTGRRENVLAGKLDGADVVVKIDAAPTEFAAQNAAHEALARGQASAEAPENVHVPKALARAPGKAFLEKALAAGDRINTLVGEEMQDRAREEERAAVVSERVPADAVSLKDLVNKTPKGAESGIELGPEDFAALEKAVAYLNGKNVRHMDLSNPSNVLVRRANGRAEFYLIDWEGVPKPSAMPDAAALAEIRGKLGLPPAAGRAAVEPPPAAAQRPPAASTARGPPASGTAPRVPLDDFFGAQEAGRLRRKDLNPGEDGVVQFRETTDGRQVVVKTEKIHPDRQPGSAREPDIQRRAAEIAQAKKGEFPSVSVPDVLGVDVRPNGEFIYVIEKAPGKGLDELLSKPNGRTIPAEKWEQFKKFMAELHFEEIAHGDVKDHNILIDDQGNLHLIDFDRAVQGEEAIRATRREIHDAQGNLIEADPIRTDELELAALEARLKAKGLLAEPPPLVASAKAVLKRWKEALRPAPAEDAVGGAATGVHAVDADAVRIHELKERLAAAPAADGSPIVLSGEETAALARTVDSVKEALRRNIGTQKDLLEGLPLGARQEQAGARGQLSSIARQLEGTTIRFEEKAGEVQAGAYAHYERESKAVVIAQRYTDLAYQHPDLMAVILEHELQHAGDLSGTDGQSARLWRGASEYRRGGANPEYVVTEALAHGSELLALDAVLKDHGIRPDRDPGGLRPRLVAEFGEAGARFVLETAGLKDYVRNDPTIFRYLLEKMPTYAEQLAGVQEGQTPARQLYLRARAMQESQKLLDVKVASLDPARAKPAYDSLKTKAPAEAERLMDDAVQRGRYESLQQDALRYRAALRDQTLARANELLAERGEPPAADQASARAALQRRYDLETAADKGRAADPAAHVKAAKAYLPLKDVLNAMNVLGEGPAPAAPPSAAPETAAPASPLARAAPGGAMDELGGFWRKVRDFVLPPPDAARDIYDARIEQDRAVGAPERLAAVLKDMRASDAQVGQLDLSPTRIQTMSDCQIRALYNHPEMEPLRRALTYDEVLDLSHRVANTRIEGDGTARGTLAQILRELGYDLTRDQPLTTATDLARDLDLESGEFVNIFWKVRRGPEASHAIVLTGAYRNGADWSFVAVDSNMKGPVVYTFDELKALGAATYRPRPRPIDGREPSAAELSGLAAEARRRYSASGVSARSLKRSDLRPVRTAGLETERRTDPLGSGWTAVGASRQGAMTVALVDSGTGRPVSTWEITRVGKRMVIREGNKLVGTVDPGGTAPMNSWMLRVRDDGIAELRLADPFAEVQASYELKVPKAP